MSEKEFYQTITYGELGEYIGNKGIVKVSKPWLKALMGKIAPQKAHTAPSEASEPDPPPSHKECSKCNQTLPLNKFNNDKRRKFGKRSQCKNCYKAQHNKSQRAEEDYPPIEYKLTNFNENDE